MSDQELCSWVCKKFSQKNRKIDLSSQTVNEIFKQRRKILKKYIRKSLEVEEVTEMTEVEDEEEVKPKKSKKHKKDKKRNRVTFADEPTKKKKVGFMGILHLLEVYKCVFLEEACKGRRA